MKVTLNISEVLRYTRSVDVELSEDMSEEGFEELLNAADRKGFWSADEYVDFLKRRGVKPLESVDISLDSPDEVEVECIDFEMD